MRHVKPQALERAEEEHLGPDVPDKSLSRECSGLLLGPLMDVAAGGGSSAWLHSSKRSSGKKWNKLLGNERQWYSGSDDNPGEVANELPKPGLVTMEAWWRSSPFQLSRRCRNRDSLLHACEFDAHHGQDLRRYCSRAALCTGRKRSRHHGNTPEFSKNTFYP